MNQDTLVLLSGMAPKEPEQWALYEWEDKFKEEYPEPWRPKDAGSEYFDACQATLKARLEYGGCASLTNEFYTWSRSFYEAEKETTQWEYWAAWMMCEQEQFTRNEWPLLWAKKRMQAAEVV